MMWRDLAVSMVCATFVAAARGQGIPTFEAAHVQLGNRPAPLAPGMFFSIYGANLGPTGGCEGHADPQNHEAPSPLRPTQSALETLIYPKELCDTQVWVGGNPAGLLYVSAGQINFKVPQETPVQGTAELRVVYQGQSSRPVAVPLGIETTTLSLEGKARVGMPVWLRVKLPYEQEPSLRYPFMIFPAAFGCNEIEVRRDGKLLPRIADLASQAFMGITIAGNICGSVALSSEPHFKGRIPLHLQYRFDQPGTYEVRLIESSPGSQAPPVSTDWTPIEILPAGDRPQWLADLSAHAPTSAADLLSDFLPDLLGIPDEQSLAILTGYLYHADRIVREYAMYGLTYWPKPQAEAAAWDLLRVNGPSDVTIEYLTHFAPDHAAQMAEVSIPFLQSDSQVLTLGALRAISRIVLATDSRVSAPLRARAEDALMRAADHFAQADPQTVNDYVSAIGQAHDARAHDLLWDLANRHVGFEQAVIALTWLKQPPDLPKLAELALQPSDGRTQEHELASLPYALHNAFGDTALPYLKRMAELSPYARVRIESARELALAGRPAAK